MSTGLTAFKASRTVLVTGGAGYIGSHAVRALLDGGWRVAVVDDLSTGFRAAIPAEVAFYHGDIADAGLMARILAENPIGAVLHFAGSIIVPEMQHRADRIFG